MQIKSCLNAKRAFTIIVSGGIKSVNAFLGIGKKMKEKITNMEKYKMSAVDIRTALLEI